MMNNATEAVNEYVPINSEDESLLAVSLTYPGRKSNWRTLLSDNKEHNKKNKTMYTQRYNK
jgi:hypothetical protein